MVVAETDLCLLFCCLVLRNIFIMISSVVSVKCFAFLSVYLMDVGYPLHLIDLLAILYRKQLAKVKVAGTLSEWFRVKKGVRQGCVLSPYLFNILLEMVMRETLDGFQGGLQIGG